MSAVRLRPLERDDLVVLKAHRTKEVDPWGFFGFQPANGLEKRFEENGLLSEGNGTLAVVDETGELVGDVGWFALQHGPSSACRALNIGIALFPQHRGRGLGTAAQRLVAEYLFETTLFERLEASTDIENVAEQRALEKAGFTREGVLRHAQFHDGQWRDVVMYSRLRGDLVGP